MQEFTIRIKKKNKVPFVKELLNNMPFVEIIDSKILKQDKKKKFLKDLDESIEFVNNYKAGKTKAKTLNEFLDEL